MILVRNVFTPLGIDCGQVEPPQNGSITKDGQLYGDSISFMCDIGHHIVGKSEALCLATGNWSADVPQCKRKLWTSRTTTKWFHH